MSKGEFLAAVRAARAELRKVLAGGDERTLGGSKIPGLDWTAKDVLSHLIGYDEAIRGATRDVRAGRRPTWPWTAPSFDPWNEANVGPRRGRPFGAVLAELEATRAALLQELEGWPEEAGPFGGDTWEPERSAIGWLASHELEHAHQIAALGEADRP